MRGERKTSAELLWREWFPLLFISIIKSDKKSWFRRFHWCFKEIAASKYIYTQINYSARHLSDLNVDHVSSSSGFFHFLFLLKDFFIFCSYHELLSGRKKDYYEHNRASTYILSSIWLFNFMWFIDPAMVSATKATHGASDRISEERKEFMNFKAINLSFVRLDRELEIGFGRSWALALHPPGK